MPRGEGRGHAVTRSRSYAVRGPPCHRVTSMGVACPGQEFTSESGDMMDLRQKNERAVVRPFRRMLVLRDGGRLLLVVPASSKSSGQEFASESGDMGLNSSRSRSELERA